MLNFLVVIIISATMVFHGDSAHAQDSQCTPGLGFGGAYNSETSYCLDGMILLNHEKYCALGDLGYGMKYDSTTSYCLDGMVLLNHEKYCFRGDLGYGMKYDSTTSYCLDGMVLLSHEKYCGKGQLGFGGKYNAETLYCLSGAILSHDQKLCPAYKSRPSFIYTEGVNTCDSNPLVAQIMSLTGDVFVIDSSGTRRIKAGDSFNVGDTILTGTDGHVVTALSDQSVVDLLPNSRLKIADYKHQASTCISLIDCISAYELQQGILRWMSGRLTYKPGFNLKTPSVTIGIRGTVFDVFHVIPNSDLYPDVEPGTYVKVIKGIVIITSGGQSIDVEESKSAFVKDESTAPVFLDQIPSTLMRIY